MVEKSFGKQLELLMQIRGMSQYDLAAAAGISQAAVSQYVCEKRLPSIAGLRNLACALDVSPASLLGDGTDSSKDVDAAADMVIANASALSKKRRNEVIVALITAE